MMEGKGENKSRGHIQRNTLGGEGRGCLWADVVRTQGFITGSKAGKNQTDQDNMTPDFYPWHCGTSYS